MFIISFPNLFFLIWTDDDEVTGRQKFETPPENQLLFTLTITIGFIILYAQMLLGRTDPPNIEFFSKLLEDQVLTFNYGLGRQLMNNFSISNIINR